MEHLLRNLELIFLGTQLRKFHVGVRIVPWEWSMASAILRV